jgi:hypothetical protein
MGHIGFPETSVMKYHYTLRNSPEERTSQLLRGGSLKSRKKYTWFERIPDMQSVWNCS